MYKLGDEKGEILEKEIAKMDAPPKNALELGTFLGYSALRTARRLAPGGKLYCIGALSLSLSLARARARASSTLRAHAVSPILLSLTHMPNPPPLHPPTCTTTEFNPDHAEVATKMLDYAGFADRTEVRHLRAPCLASDLAIVAVLQLTGGVLCCRSTGARESEGESARALETQCPRAVTASA
jgi:hypothetical protein